MHIPQQSNRPHGYSVPLQTIFYFLFKKAILKEQLAKYPNHPELQGGNLKAKLNYFKRQDDTRE